jgi:hypothetical protein
MFNRVLELQTRQEQLTAMMPGLSNEARHYNAGRAAALADFQEMLVKKWLESRVSQ